MVFDGSIDTYGVDKGLIARGNKYGNEQIFSVRATWEYIQYLLWLIARQNIPKYGDNLNKETILEKY